METKVMSEQQLTHGTTVKEGVMNMRQLLLAIFSLLVGWGMAGVAQAAPTVSFEAGDRPGNFFTCSNTGNSASIGCVPGSIGGAKQRSLAVIAPGETVGFPSVSGEASTIHTALSLLWPTGATHDGGTPFATQPFKAAIDFRNPVPGGVATVQLDTPGLYVFICDIHVYMFATVIVDDPTTAVVHADNLVPGLGLDLGQSITLVNGIGPVPTASDLALRLVKTDFMITDPDNWKDYNKTDWQPKYPPVPVIAYDVDGNEVPVPNLNTLLQSAPVNAKAQLHNPTTPAIGEIWINTQFELTAGKSKPGMATAIDGITWALTKKVALPEINMNHPHNMWTDKNQEVIYQTQWFDERVAVFDRKTGALIRELNAGQAPSHVMTRANNDQVHVAQNGGNHVRQFDSYADGNGNPVDLSMTVAAVNDSDIHNATHPHGHWMSADGMKMVTPNENVWTSTVYDFGTNTITATVATGAVPLATGMMPDSSKYYVANFLDSTISVFQTSNGNLLSTIDLLKIGTNYDPISGVITDGGGNPVGPVGALPIQTPVSPDGTNMVTANTLTATITVVDTTTDQVVAMLPCDPGCHGVQYGAKQGGGYYAYVASKFSNAMIVVDPDPNGDGDPSDAAIVGRVLLAGSPAGKKAVQDDTVIGNPGMGGQGTLAVPNVYNGWVQQWVQNCKTKDCNSWKKQMTSAQKDPGPVQ
ncbi:MAG: hypothetical protein OEY86_12415 [Nitrospira sp.]|nr:hypothetical protein [Nitrospira sp.]